MKSFKSQHNRRSIRLKEFDYANPGWYYVTICNKNFKRWFGDVKNGKINYNTLGNVAFKYFEEIPKHFEIIELDYFVIMPNHIHGIIIINDSVETRDRVSLRQFGGTVKNSLSMVINQYKGSVARFAHKNGYKDFAWQSRFYDHIIRNDKDLHRIRTYIQSNPLKWELDEYNN